MAMTRKALKAMGLTDEQIDSIIEMHTETVDGLKDRLRTAEGKAEQLDGVQKELDDLKAKGGDYKAKYEQAKKELDDYKADVTAKETKAAKEKAIRKYISECDFSGKKITGDNLDIAMMAIESRINSFELDGDKIKETPELKDVISKLEKLSASTVVQGAQTATPPNSTGNAGYKTKAEIFKKDEHGRYILSTAERQKALAENPDLLK